MQFLNPNKNKIVENYFLSGTTASKEVENFICSKTQESKNLVAESIQEDEEKEAEIETAERNIHSKNIIALLKLVPEFNGNGKILKNFLNLLEYIHDTLKTEDRKKLRYLLTLFILKCVFHIEVRNRIKE